MFISNFSTIEIILSGSVILISGHLKKPNGVRIRIILLAFEKPHRGN